mgnify:CR=1 FL=1
MNRAKYKMRHMQMATSFTGRGVRYPAPDVARGFMLLLIAVANVPVWNQVPDDIADTVQPSSADTWWVFIRELFVDHRAYPLFAMLFGFGLVTMVNRRIASGTSSYLSSLPGVEDGCEPTSQEAAWAREQATVDARRLVRRRGLRLPPPLLNRVASALSGDDRDEVVAVMDERDRAVFALDERWAARIRRFAQRNAPPDPARWEEGDAQERADYLARLRRTDPDAARALLADGAWLRARAPEREQILNALAIGLGPADEQILEARLDDRAEAVRGRAAELLSRLPSSALIARAEALAERHVVVTRRALRAPAVELHGIEMTDALARDRYPAKAHRTSASLARLEEVIARIPTWRWPDLVGISKADISAFTVFIPT